jgi:hypothetical protein
MAVSCRLRTAAVAAWEFRVRSAREVVALLAGCLIAACGSNGGEGRPDIASGAPPTVELRRAVPSDARMMGEPTDGVSMAPARPGIDLPSVGEATLIAYSYSMSLELPARNVVALRDAHLAACTAAGPRKCQVLGSGSSVMGEDQVTAELRLRGEPQWLATFRAAVESDAAKSEGRVISSAIGSEDLTRQIVDTEATLRAQTTLRDRLRELLAKHQGKLADLLEVERELARVQGEIDSRTSQLAVMRARVAMSDLSVTYVSRAVLVGDRTGDPTLQALLDFVDIVSHSFASVIRFVAGVLPWLLVIAPIAWLLRRWWRRRRWPA